MRSPELRDVEDRRLAFAILNTRWHRLGRRRLRAHEVIAFHRAFSRGQPPPFPDGEMPVSLEQAYRMVGRHAQQAFWGDRRPEASMLHHIAMRAAAR